MQGVLEQAIGAVTGESVRVIASGRTDAGAHALGQVIAFTTASDLPAGTLQRALTAHLPPDVTVTAVDDVGESYHPRYDACARRYRYLIWNRAARSPLWHDRALHVPVSLDVCRMHAAAQCLIGEHDFSSFVPTVHAGSRVRTMYVAGCRRTGDLVSIELEGNGFMRQMVRSIAGTLVRVGLGKLSVSEFAAVLAARDRARAAGTAPAHGLYLVGVRYGNAQATTSESRAEESSPRIEEIV